MISLIQFTAGILSLAALSAGPIHAQTAPTKDIVDAAAAGLVDMLKGEGPYTVFAPTDEAFSELGEQLVNNLLMPDNKALPIEMLSNHVVAIARISVAGPVMDIQPTCAGSACGAFRWIS